MREGGAAIILQRTKQGIDVDLVASRREETAAVVVAEIVAERAHRTGRIVEIFTRSAGIQDSASDRHHRAAVVDPASNVAGPVAAKSAVAQRQGCAAEGAIVADAAADAVGADDAG